MTGPAITLYKVGQPVKGVDFYGRADLLKRVRFQLMRTNVILVQGQRRIGKTSFLHELAGFLPSESVTDSRFVPVIFDIQRYAGDTLAQFQQHLVQEIVSGLRLPDAQELKWSGEPVDFDQVWLPQLMERLGDRQLVLLVDEFDNLGEESGSQPIRTLVPFISRLINNEPRLKWILTVGRQVGKLPIQYDPIVSRAAEFPISRLSREETQRLVVEPAAGVLLYQPEAIERIYQLASGQPMLTQALCQKLVEQVVLDEEREVATAADVDAVLDSTIEAYEGAISSIARVPLLEERVLVAVAQLTPSEQTTDRAEIVRLLSQQDLALQLEELTTTMNRLVEWDLLVREGDRVRLAVEMVRIWVARNIALAPTQEEKIDLLQVRAHSRYELAVRALRAGQPDIAITEYTEALQLVPLYPEALRGLAEAYRLTGDLAGLAKTLQKLYRQDITVKPALVEALASYASLCEQQGDLPTAAEQYQELLTLENSDRWRQVLVRVRVRVATRVLEAPINFDEHERAIHMEQLAALQQQLEFLQSLVTSEVEASQIPALLQEIARHQTIITTLNLAEEWQQKGDPSKAAQYYESLLDLQKRDQWVWSLIQARLQESRQFLGTKEHFDREALSKDLTKSSQVLERFDYLKAALKHAQALDSREKQQDEVNAALERLAQQRQIIAAPILAEQAVAAQQWQEAGQALVGLKASGVTLTRQEQAWLKQVAVEKLINKDGWLYQRAGFVFSTFWRRSVAGIFLGLLLSLLVVELVPVATEWAALIYVIVMTMSMGVFISSIHRRREVILFAHIVAAAIAAAVVWLFNSAFTFPPSPGFGAYSLHILVVAIPIGVAYATAIDPALEGILTGIVVTTFSVIFIAGGAQVGSWVAEIISYFLPPLAATGFGLGVGWAFAILLFSWLENPVFLNIETAARIVRREQ